LIIKPCRAHSRRHPGAKRAGSDRRRQTGEHIATLLDGGRSRFIYLLRAADAVAASPQLRLDWFRLLEPGQLTETLMISSTLSTAIELDVCVMLTSDFAPLDLIMMGEPTSPLQFPEPSGDHLVWVRDDTSVALMAEGAALHLSEDRRQLTLQWWPIVPARGEVSLSWQLSVQDLGSGGVVPSTAPLKIADLSSAAARVDHRLWPWLARSLEDPIGLWTALRDSPDDGFFAAGAPWYLTLFGRDSIWTARMLLPLELESARGTLRTLARYQGRRVDIATAEEPGKILHELRRTERRLGTMSLPPVYYGTIDATPLWICLLHDAWRAGLPSADVAELLPALERALGWLTECGDADGDGLLEYQDASGHGLANHGWKDSDDSMRFHDGRIAAGPVALCEAQGYAYEAAISGAALLDAFGRPAGDRYRSWADELAGRFRTQFWCGQGGDRYPALALDGDKRQVDSLTSNIGHLLGTGLLNAEEELMIARRISSEALDSGLGLRPLAASEAGYAPLSYHCGSVWPHDTAIVIVAWCAPGWSSMPPV
jgi:Mannosylglycerate hydrolase MGH1-like glycoside hydrolase domain